MLQWTAAGSGPRLCLLVHHTEATRDVAYDRDSVVERLAEPLTQAGKSAGTVVDMLADWARIYP